MSDELPLGWITTRISELAWTSSGGTPSTAKREYWDNGNVPWINSGALKDCVINEPSTYITKLGSENSAAKLFPKNTVVIALTGATTGRVGILDFACSANQSVTGIFPSEAFVPSYVFNFLRSARPNVLELAIGSAQPHINKRIVDDFELPLAPLAEQRRIVGKLDAVLGKVDASEQRLAKIPVVLKRFRQSVLATACSGRLTADWREQNGVSEEFERTTLDTIAEYVGGFAFKSPSFLEMGRHQVIRIGNVRPFVLNLSASPVFIPDDIAAAAARFKLKTDDVVISMTGTKYKRDYGCAGIVREDHGSLFLNQRVARVRCGRSVLPKFLLFWLQTELFRGFFFSGETGNVNQGNVGASGIRNAPIELPPLAEQHEIVRRVEGLFALADQLELRLTKARTQVDKLTPSLLARAFRGELVPQDPNDEPATALLERIRQQRNGNERDTPRLKKKRK
jgi:type I restriction enzyme S subunit